MRSRIRRINKSTRRRSTRRRSTRRRSTRRRSTRRRSTRRRSTRRRSTRRRSTRRRSTRRRSTRRRNKKTKITRKKSKIKQTGGAFCRDHGIEYWMIWGCPQCNKGAKLPIAEGRPVPVASASASPVLAAAAPAPGPASSPRIVEAAESNPLERGQDRDRKAQRAEEMGEPLLRSHDRVLTEEGTAAAMEHGSAEPEPQVDEEKKEGGAKMLLIDQALLIAANTGDADEVRRCLRDGADPNAQIPGWRLTALYIAATENHVRCMEALAEAGGDLDQANVDGRTPLMAAARSGHTAAVEWLLGRGADWRLTDINGKTALDIAKQVNHVETAAVLERPDLLGVPSESFPQPQSGDPAVSAA